MWKRWATTEDHLGRRRVSSSGCWILPNKPLFNGYVRVNSMGRSVRAHKLMWEAANGPVPPGLELDHLCRNRACCNPAHLEAVDRATNVRRGGNAAKTHCKRGHELTRANTYDSQRPYRMCKTCNREKSRARASR